MLARFTSVVQKGERATDHSTTALTMIQTAFIGGLSAPHSASNPKFRPGSIERPINGLSTKVKKNAPLQ